MTQTEREMRAEFEGAFRAHWRPEMSIGANSLNVAKIFAWSMWQAATALAKHEGAQAVYLVATGETYEGRETYTRHESLVELADVEKLYTAAPDTRDADARLEWLFTHADEIMHTPENGDPSRLYRIFWWDADGDSCVTWGATPREAIDAARSTT